MSLLPTPWAWMKKVLSILKSNLSPNQIAAAFALGVFAGLPPMGLHVVIPITMALLFRCSFRAFLISMGLFKLLSLGLAPVSFRVGTWLLDTHRGLDALWRWVFHLPILAPMGYPRYLLFGGIVMSFVFAIPVFFVVRWLVRRYRVSFAAWVSKWRVSQWLKGRRGVGIARRLFAGGDAKYETQPAPKGVFRIVRKKMLIGIPVLYACAYLLAAVVVPFFAGTLATNTASWAIGAEVSVDDASFNLLTGALSLTGFSVQDPKAPAENLIVIPEVVVDAGMLPLLSKRVVFNRVTISEASMHVVREPDGTLNVDNAAAGWDAEAYADWALQHAGKVDWLGLLRKLLDALSTWQPPAPRTNPTAEYAGGRSFPAFRAPFAVQRLEIGRLLITLEDQTASHDAGPLPRVTMIEVEVSNLAYPAELRTKPIAISLHGQWGDDPESGFRLVATFSETNLGGTTEVEFAIRRLDLPRLAAFYATTLPVQIESGWASMTGSWKQEGSVSVGSVSFLLEDLRLSQSDGSVFGLPPETSVRVLEGINRYAQDVPVVFGAEIEGSAESPHLAWEAPLLEVAREGLMLVGRRELQTTIEGLGIRVEELGGIENMPLDPSFKAVRSQAETVVRDELTSTVETWLQDFVDIPGDPGEGPADPGSGSSDVLPGLLENLLNPTDDAPGSTENGDT